MARPKQFDVDDTLDAAMRVFWAQGYAQTSPQRLVDELSIGRGSLYDTYGDKRSLFTQSLRRYVDQSSDLVVRRLTETDGTAAHRLRTALGAVVEALGSEPWGCLLTNTAVELAPHDDELAIAVRAAFERQRDAFEAVLEQGRADGSLRTDLVPADVATRIIATTNGLQVLARAGVDPAALAPALESLVDDLVAG